MLFDPDSFPASWILGIIARDGDAEEFYHSGFWKAKRREVLRNQHRWCWRCLQKSPEVHTRANTVHHLYPLRERPDLALEEFAPDGSPNLVCLCPSCHWEEHHKRRSLDIPERW